MSSQITSDIGRIVDIGGITIDKKKNDLINDLILWLMLHR